MSIYIALIVVAILGSVIFGLILYELYKDSKYYDLKKINLRRLRDPKLKHYNQLEPLLDVLENIYERFNKNHTLKVDIITITNKQEIYNAIDNVMLNYPYSVEDEKPLTFEELYNEVLDTYEQCNDTAAIAKPRQLCHCIGSTNITFPVIFINKSNIPTDKILELLNTGS